MEKKKKKQSIEGSSGAPSASPWQAFLVLMICGLGLASALGVARNVYSINLTSDPSDVLRLIWVIEAPIAILSYSLFRKIPKQCSYWRAIGRGLLGLPAGAVINALGAIALGAPVGFKYFPKTLNWSLLMSVFTVVPAASVFGSSWADWQQIYAHAKPSGLIEYMVCLPAHGAVVGAWLGAWPMPLDWERPWQEWPICVSYGAITGYLVALVVSLGLVLLHHRRQHVKAE